MARTIERLADGHSENWLTALRRKTRSAVHRLVLSKPLARIYDSRNKHLSLGDRGEIAAERFLLRRGWIIVARGFETEQGEIDIVAVDGETVVFVEVKTRTNLERGLPEEAVDETKQRKIVAMATAFIRRYRLDEQHFRFDVISILWPNGAEPDIKHLVGAFDGTEL